MVMIQSRALTWIAPDIPPKRKKLDVRKHTKRIPPSRHQRYQWGVLGVIISVDVASARRLNAWRKKTWWRKMPIGWKMFNGVRPRDQV